MATSVDRTEEPERAVTELRTAVRAMLRVLTQSNITKAAEAGNVKTT